MEVEPRPDALTRTYSTARKRIRVTRTLKWNAMRQYNFQFTLSDLAFVLVSFTLLGAGCMIMWLDGFDAWFAYLLALPTYFAAATIRSAFRRASRVDQSGGTQDTSDSSQSPPSPE